MGFLGGPLQPEKNNNASITSGHTIVKKGPGGKKKRQVGHFWGGNRGNKRARGWVLTTPKGGKIKKETTES